MIITRRLSTGRLFDKVGGGAPAEGGVPGQDTGTGRTGRKIEVPVSFRAPPGGTEI